QESQQNDADAIARDDDVKLIQEAMHHVGDDDQQLRPETKSAIVSQGVQVKVIDVEVKHVLRHALAIGPGRQIAQQLHLYGSVIQQVVLCQRFLDVERLGADAHDDVVKIGLVDIARPFRRGATVLQKVIRPVSRVHD